MAERIRVELLKFMKGKKLLEKGTIFDTKNGPLPKDIEIESVSFTDQTATLTIFYDPNTKKKSYLIDLKPDNYSTILHLQKKIDPKLKKIHSRN